MILTLSVIAFFLTLLTSWIFLLKAYKSFNIPGPIPLPIVGNCHLFAGSPRKLLPTLDKFRQIYGDAVQFRLLHDPYVLLYHPKYIVPLLAHNHHINKSSSYDVLHDWLGFGLITSTGAHWRSHRKFLTPAFQSNILHSFMPVFLKNAKTLLSKLQLANLKQGAIDVLPLISLNTLDNATESIMGVPINAQENSDSKYVKALEEVTKIVAWKMRNPIIAVDFIFKLTPYKKIYEEALKVLHAQSREIIEIRRKVLKNDNITRFPENAEFDVRNKHAFLDQILLSEIDGEKIDDEGARQEVDTFMFAGHDTTAAAISFTLYCISEYDNIQEKILEEQKKIFDNDLNKKPTYRDLKQMKYLEMVIKESLRLFPPVPIIGRFITEDCDLGDIHVKKNTSVNINIFHMHRHPELHENPNKFCPERFDMSSAPSQNTFSSIPFSAGPRNCIGQKFAMMEIKITVAEIVKNFKLLPANIQPVLCADLVLKSDNGVHVHLTSRHC